MKTKKKPLDSRNNNAHTYVPECGIELKAFDRKNDLIMEK